jgi:hypothetical protein
MFSVWCLSRVNIHFHILTSEHAKQTVTLGTLVFPPMARVDQQSNKCVGHLVTISKKLAADAIHIDGICSPPIRIY